MNDAPLAPYEHVVALRTGLAEHFESNAFLACESMGALLRENLRQVRSENDWAARGPGRGATGGASA
jgi:hypothetical protein